MLEMHKSINLGALDQLVWEYIELEQLAEVWHGIELAVTWIATKIAYSERMCMRMLSAHSNNTVELLNAFRATFPRLATTCSKFVRLFAP